MRVGVDQAGREDRIGLVNLVPGRVFSCDLGGGTDFDNAVSADGDGSVFDHASLGVFGDDVARGPDDVDGLLRRQTSAKEQRDGDRACEADQTIRLAL